MKILEYAEKPSKTHTPQKHYFPQSQNVLSGKSMVFVACVFLKLYFFATQCFSFFQE